MIIGIIGPEGAGKTCIMTYFGLVHLANKGRLLTFPGYEVTEPNHGKPISEPLDIDQWVTMPPEFRDLEVAIDEIQNFFNSRRHMSVLNYLFANLAAQRRHRNLGVMYTVQDWGWLDDRIRWLTHVLVVCSDLYWSSWGKEQGISRGELISAAFFDVKGFFTGRPWTPGPQFLLKARNIWQCYNSYADVDTWTGLTKVEFKKPKLTIDLTASKEGEEGEAPPKLANKVSTEEGDTALLSDLANTPGINPTTLRRLAGRLMKG
jgi:hypothetical protein